MELVDQIEKMKVKVVVVTYIKDYFCHQLGKLTEN